MDQNGPAAESLLGQPGFDATEADGLWQRRLTLARRGFIWLGIALLGLISLDALGRLAREVAVVLLRVDQPVVLGGLLLSVLAVGIGLAMVAVLWWLAGREPRGSGLALLCGVVLTVAIRALIAGLQDGVVDGEMRAYHELAVGMLQGECCFGDRPMGYPMMLAGVYAFLGVGPAAAEWLNIGFAALTAASLFLLVRRAYGARPAAVALAFYAMWPAGALMTVVRLPETAYDSVIVLAAIASLTTRPGWPGSVGTGGLLALGQYLRPSTPVLLPVYLLARIWGDRHPRRAVLAGMVLLVAAFLVPLAPVVAYNLEAHGELSIATSAYGGWSLYVGTNTKTGGTWSRADVERIDAYGAANVWERSRIAGELGIRRILDDPVGFARLAVRKFDTLWGTEDDAVDLALRRGISARPEATFPALPTQLFWAFATTLATVGLYMRRRRADRLAVLTVGVVLAVTLIHTFLEVRARYHSYALPLLLALAGLAATELWQRWRSRQTRGGPLAR